MRAAKATIDHDTIRAWVEEREGRPAHVRGTGSDGDPGILRIDFPRDAGDDKLEPIDWEQFFRAFDANQLAFLYQDEPNGRFVKLVSRRSVQERIDKPAAPKKGRRGKKKAAASPDISGDGRGKSPHAIRLLEQQHREVEGMFADYEGMESPQEKRDCCDKICDTLAAHAKIEETIFYPTALAGETEEDLREAVEEHLAMKRVIADLLELDSAHEQFDAKVAVLKDLVEHHVEDEEGKLFKMLGRIDDETWRSLGMMMQDAFDQLIKEEPRREVPKETGAAAPL